MSRSEAMGSRAQTEKLFSVRDTFINRKEEGRICGYTFRCAGCFDGEIMGSFSGAQCPPKEQDEGEGIRDVR